MLNRSEYKRANIRGKYGDGFVVLKWRPDVSDSPFDIVTIAVVIFRF